MCSCFSNRYLEKRVDSAVYMKQIRGTYMIPLKWKIRGRLIWEKDVSTQIQKNHIKTNTGCYKQLRMK